MSDDRYFRPGVVPAATVVLVLMGLLLAAGALGVSALLRGCDRTEPVQMLPRPTPSATPAARSAANAGSSAATTATQGLRISGRRIPAAQVTSPKSAGHPEEQGSGASQVTTPDGDVWEWVIEASQSITMAATASAQASASVAAPEASVVLDHGRLGVIAATMPGILAADLELARVDVPPWLVGVPLELGLDVAGNLEAGTLGVSVGSKAFALVGYWSRWNLSAQGVTVGAGLRF